METVPIFTYIPPVKYYEELKIDPTMVIDKFIAIIERLYGSLSPVGGLHNNWIGFYLWLCEVLKNKEISAVYVYGSSVYRMDNPHDITDIDIFILSKSKVNVPEELKEILHVQRLSHTLSMYEICGLSQQLLVLKTSEEGERLIERVREIFNEDYLFALILRDVYKVCATKKISDIKDEALKEKIRKMKLNPKSDDQESPYFVRSMLKQNAHYKIEEGELLTLLDFSFKRRKVKPEYAEKIKERAKVFWKTGQL